jgi:hypothetical protein
MEPSAMNENFPGTYVPSPSEFVRDQVETYERTAASRPTRSSTQGFR